MLDEKGNFLGAYAEKRNYVTHFDRSGKTEQKSLKKAEEYKFFETFLE